jgi:Tol biopolymer transport system component
MRRSILALVTLGLLQLAWAIPALAEGTFEDVPDSSVFSSEIDWLAGRNITKGCNPSDGNTRFCPDEYVTRGQMAAFLVRAFGYTDTGGTDFVDDDGSVFEDDITRLAAAGVTRGCNPDEGNTRFCPDDLVTRGQMAAFLSRAFGYFDTATAAFADDGGVFQADIRRLATAGVTRGCNPDDGNTRFCPDDFVTRGQMAAFLFRAFQVPGGGVAPTPTSTSTSTTVPSGPVDPSTVRVSVDSAGHEASSDSDSAAISADGRYVAFVSDASALVSGDTNGVVDVFVHDRETGVTERISVSDSGAQADGASSTPWISAHGRYVVFSSTAGNLASGDGDAFPDVFLRDRVAGTTVTASVTTSGQQSNGASTNPSVSDDGRYVLFQSTATNLVGSDGNGNVTDVFLRDTLENTTSVVSLGNGNVWGNGGSGDPFITADGRYVVFQSGASNLVAGDTNGSQDVFVKDRVANTLERVSVSTSEAQGNGHSYGPTSISPDGRYVAFESDATNLVTGDTNGKRDIFVRDLQAGTTTRVSVNSSEQQANGESRAPVISDGGRFVAFYSEATNLVAGDTNGEFDILLRDLVAGTTIRLSVDTNGDQAAGGHSVDPAISAGGRFIAFHSGAPDLVADDTNGRRDVFVRDLGVG